MKNDTFTSFSVNSVVARPSLEYHYWHPLENPTHDRLRFGLLVWKIKLDGVMPYAYQSLGGESGGWDDWGGSPKPYRPENYTYPTKNGFVPTIQWEATREGIDDVRYLTTLEYWVEKAQKTKEKPGLKEAVDEAQKILSLPEIFYNDFNTLNRKLTPKDFEDLRIQIIKNILIIKKILTASS